MGKKQVMEIIKDLAKSQGFYGRLYRNIIIAEENGEDLEPWFAQFKDCKTSLDVVLKIEQ